MTTCSNDRRNPPGFTLLELLVVLSVLACLASLLVPALAGAHPQNRTFQCFNNHRRLAMAWRMYAEDNSDRVIYNLGASALLNEISQGTFRNCANNIMDWSLNSMNTNRSLLDRGILAPYLGADSSAYKCPSDKYLSASQAAARWTARTRSVSMNGFFGPYTTNPADPSFSSGKNTSFPIFRQWLKVAEVAKPASAWVFIDEHPDSINDPYFINNPMPTGQNAWLDVPAALHNGAVNLDFADGHAETHKWLSNTTRLPVRFVWNPPAFDQLGRADYLWLATRTAVPY